MSSKPPGISDKWVKAITHKVQHTTAHEVMSDYFMVRVFEIMWYQMKFWVSSWNISVDIYGNFRHSSDSKHLFSASLRVHDDWHGREQDPEKLNPEFTWFTQVSFTLFEC